MMINDIQNKNSSSGNIPLYAFTVNDLIIKCVGKSFFPRNIIKEINKNKVPSVSVSCNFPINIYSVNF